MPISPSTSISDPTSLRQPDDLPIPVAASLETSADATACHNTFSHEKAFDSPPAIRRGRRSFQRLPISKLAASLKDAEASEFEFENDQDVEATREGEENLPQSPGDSPVSRFSPYQEERSPTATLFTRLVFGFQSHKRSRNRSGSVGSGKRLHASPPPASPAPRGLALEPEDFIVPKRKVAKRKPIPTSLFSSVSGERDKQCSVSVPDVFSDFNSHVYDEEEGSHKIDARNSLGLFLPTIELQQQQPHASTSGTLTDPNLDQVSDTQAWASQHRLRRSTRSISESHSRRRVTSLGASRVSSTTSTSTQITFARRTVDFAGLSDSTSSDSSSGDDREHTTKRGRTRGGSEPVYPCSFERFSIDDSRPLRRVSRKRTGEMRSVYLSDPSTDSLLRRLQPLLMQNVKGGEEGEAIEVLKTPDETSQATFGNLARISMSFSSPSKGGSLGSVDSGFSRRGSGGSENWGGLGSSSGDGLSTASMAVLQQQIQMQNWQRMVGADSGGVGGRRREEEKEDGSREKATRVGEGRQDEGEMGLVKQYGAMRITQWPSSDELDEAEPHSRSSTQSSSTSDSRQPSSAVGLRHMFSDSHLSTTTGSEAEAISLRQRRAKPLITIALSTSASSKPTTTATTTTNSSSRFSADVIGPFIPLRKNPSQSILSPSSIHSPPPCPPSCTPLPDLPVPKSAPIVVPSVNGKVLNNKRSFVRSSSTPVSPLDTPTVVKRGPRGAPKSQSCNIDSAYNFGRLTTSISQDGGDTADSSVLHTPPLTGGLPLMMVVSDHKQRDQPMTPLSALTESSIATPLTAQPVGGVVGGKFDSLLAYLSSSRGDGEKVGEAERGKRGQAKGAAEGGDANEVGMASDEVVYGLAL